MQQPEINPEALKIFIKEFHPEILKEFEARYLGFFRGPPKGTDTIKRQEIKDGQIIGYHTFKRH